jgi:peptidyl-prolyl cis-trans isomerase C
MTLIVNRSVGAADAKPPVVSVNGIVIQRDAIAQEIQNHPAPKPLMAWQAAARALVVRELLLQEASRIGLHPEPEADEAGRRETDQEALLRQLAESEIVTPEPDEDVCRRYYENNTSRFRTPDIYEASHILIAGRADDVEALGAAQGQASALLVQLRDRPDLFAELARLHSACPSGKQGGNLGQISTGQTTPEFERALGALAPGETTKAPVPSRYGFHIIHLDRKIEGCVLPYELVAERIGSYLKERVQRRATAQYIARLVSRAKIAGIEIEGAEAHRVN